MRACQACSFGPRGRVRLIPSRSPDATSAIIDALDRGRDRPHLRNIHVTSTAPSAQAGNRWPSAIDAAVEYAFHALVFALPLAFYVEGSFKVYEFAKLRVLYGAAAVILGGWALGVVLRRRFVLYRSPLDIPLLIYALALAVSTALSTNVPRSLWGRYATPAGAFIPIAVCVSLYFAYVTHLRTRQQLMRNLGCFAAGGAVTAAWSVIQHYGLDWINLDQQVSFFGRSTGTFGNPAPQGWYVALMLPIAAWLFFEYRGRMRILTGTFWFLLVLALLSTGTRSGFIGAAGGVACLAVALAALRRRQPHLNLRPTLALAVLFALAVTLYVTEKHEGENFADRVSIWSLSSAANLVRYPLWRDALLMWKQYPVWGCGPDTFGDQHNFVRTSNLDANALVIWGHAHNEYLQQLVTAGVVGLAAYLFVIGVFLVHAFGILKRLLRLPVWEQTPFDLIWPIALTASAISLLISQNFNPDYLATTLAFYIVPGMVIGWGALNGEMKVISIEFAIPPVAKIGAVAGLVFCVALSSQQNLKLWDAHLSFRRAIAALEQNKFAAARTLIDRAVAASPSDANYWWVKAQTYAFLTVIMKREAQSPSVIEASERMAIAASDRSILLDPHREDLWRQRAICLGDLSEVDPSLLPAAVDAIRQSIARFPTNDVSYVFLARLESRRGQRDAARQALVTAINLAPTSAIALAELGALQYRTGDRAAAAGIVTRFLELRPTIEQWQLVSRLRDEAATAGDAASRQTLDAYLLTLSPSRR